MDPEQLAAGIRRVAIDAHQALHNPFVTATRMNELFRQIRELRMAARASSLSEIDCWLDRLQRQVEVLASGSFQNLSLS